jgi:hypothetical protein
MNDLPMMILKGVNFNKKVKNVWIDHYSAIWRIYEYFRKGKMA